MRLRVDCRQWLPFDRMVEAGIILGVYFLIPGNALSYILFFIAAMFNFTIFIIAGALFNNSGEKSMHYDADIFLIGVIRFYRIMKNIEIT